jgi:hypothetical protein
MLSGFALKSTSAMMRHGSSFQPVQAADQSAPVLHHSRAKLIACRDSAAQDHQIPLPWSSINSFPTHLLPSWNSQVSDIPIIYERHLGVRILSGNPSFLLI